MSDSKRKFDNTLAGVIVAFDPETGDALHVHEKYVETIDGEQTYSDVITDDEREHVRAEAIERYPRRRIDVISALPEDVFMNSSRPELAGPERARYHVDPMTRKVRVELLLDVDLLQERLRMACGSHQRGR
jgi:hypothetical protein